MDKCNRYENSMLANWTQSENICLADNYNNDKIQRCPGNAFVFRNDEVTISNEVSIKVFILFAINHVIQTLGPPRLISYQLEFTHTPDSTNMDFDNKSSDFCTYHWTVFTSQTESYICMI